MIRLFDHTVWGLLAGAFVLVISAFFLKDWMLFTGIQSLGMGAVALGMLVLWRTGLISFGHALFFGFSAYTVALLNEFAGVTDYFLLVFAGTLSAGILAFVLGFLLRRYRAIFFALLNLAFSMILWGVLAKIERLGSTDGIGVSSPTFLGIKIEGMDLMIVSFILAVIFSLLVAVAVHLYLKSTLGVMTMAVRENEIRVEYLGYSVERVIHIKYVISGLLAGFGGAIVALSLGHVDPDSLVYWPISGEFVFITILGGTGSVVAPFIAALLFELLRTYAFEWGPQIVEFCYALVGLVPTTDANIWQLIMGGTLLILIMFIPNGLWSIINREAFKR